MKNLFPGYYRLTDEEFRELWAKAIFVFDSNMLLNLYRFPHGPRNELLDRMEALSGRVWLPHHVALEFQRNRLTVIAEQVKKFTETRNAIEKSIGNLKTEISKLNLEKRHSSIETEPFLAKIDAETEKFLQNLALLKKAQLTTDSSDAIRERLDRIFDTQVGSPLDEEEIKDLVKDGKKRYEHAAPPGYMDGKKEERFFYNNVFYERRYGDLIIWRQLLKHVKKSDIHHVIVVTDDSKEDWWWQVESEGKKTIGPRPELVAEIRDAGVTLYHQYNSDQFLKRSSDLLNLPTNDEFIEQIQDVRASETAFEQSKTAERWEEAIINWVVSEQGTNRLMVGELPGSLQIDVLSPYKQVMHNYFIHSELVDPRTWPNEFDRIRIEIEDVLNRNRDLLLPTTIVAITSSTEVASSIATRISPLIKKHVNASLVVGQIIQSMWGMEFIPIHKRQHDPKEFLLRTNARQGFKSAGKDEM